MDGTNVEFIEFLFQINGRAIVSVVKLLSNEHSNFSTSFDYLWCVDSIATFLYDTTETALGRGNVRAIANNTCSGLSP